ncbi:alanine--tRNA ligase/DNA-binding transcriptional repressor [Methylococcus capsulatus]|uniref:Alanine--tRNA ligase n=1 Tax=Methylococcus capsulatus TaxID=414 RepID=A0AA35XZZ3_METCP|nr:alanine--tRNA ligase [Methylococcus capsulatus]CAI8768838.1 alanine--tRNA ligase/DNA-binding transcriptional repressor [Methylococcus capsulatus]
MTSAELRARFLKFFADRGHTVVASSSLVPVNDPTLLFTNAGMVQFKDVFLGREHRPYVRAASAQRCVRAGGKHNDLENVGYTARHHTFFEMLGNFSFGDYFKREAIVYAWEFLTEVLMLPPERLWITVYAEDKEAERIWLEEVGVDPGRFTRIATSDNFWSMGDTGPCGPCSEIFYDHGPSVAGGPPGTPEEDGDRYVEIWNLVFMQYERAGDGTLTPLPKPSVDTGMGLERLAAVMQRVHNNYDIDLFRNLVKAAAELAGTADLAQGSLRVIADHIRSCAFLVTDGVLPSNEGRGYVLRRIIRRAIRHGYKLGIREPFFYKLVGPLCAEMGQAYPELVEARPRVEQVLDKEEERFAETLEQGMKILDVAIRDLGSPVISGDTAFQLYDTYGFPVDLTADVAREHGLRVDMAGFERAMEAQRERARAASHFSVDYSQEIHLDVACEFTGYWTAVEDTRIVALLRDGQAVDRLEAGEDGVVVLEKTPFYAESGGQVGDRGVIRSDSAVFEVADTRKQGSDLILHRGKLREGVLLRGAVCRAEVEQSLRQATALNHSATHLLHAALRRVLGEHVTQKGSLVDPERLRFDFSHFEPVSPEQLDEIERLVNREIRRNAEVTAEVMAKDAAMRLGAMALFGEKYGDDVRVLRIGDFSTELCGGIHARRAGDIGLFKIVSESGVAAGVRRIEAVTGAAAVEAVEATERLLRRLAERMKAGRDTLEERLDQMFEKNRALERELERLKAKTAGAAGADLASRAVDIAGVKVLAARVDEADARMLRELVDQLKDRLGSAAIVLAAVEGGKVSLVAGVTRDQTGHIRAGDLVNSVATRIGGKGGGRPDLAQAGGNRPEELQGALDGVPEWVRRMLNA